MQGMKKLMQVALVGVLMASLLGFAGCGKGSDPKALAKQSIEMLGAIRLDGTTDEKAEADAKKLGEKIAALSEADQKIYQEELQRLMKEAFGLNDKSDNTDAENAAK
jgi:adenylate kinase family enzyme